MTESLQESGLLRVFLLLLIPVLCRAAERVNVAILIQANDEVSSQLLEGLQEETNGLWGFGALELKWLIRGREFNAASRVLVVRMRGECSAVARPHGDQSPVFGVTHITDGQVLPFIDIDCDAVAAAVTRKRIRSGMFLDVDSYARALAVVLTHEMVHALTASTDHEVRGLMQPYLSADELLSPETALSTWAIGKLSASLEVPLIAGERRGRAGRQT